ncbi:MAG: DUF3179 domain-containing protein [Actinomycetota bacterium]|nr:DUF3179 domain-containing protein [Actinomycetota bacterium]
MKMGMTEDDAGPRRPGPGVVALAVVGTLFAAAVGWGLVNDAPPGAGGDPKVSGIALTDFQGEKFSLGDYEGKPLVVNFWASWCPSCTAEMPAFDRAYRKLESQVAFVGINQNDTHEAARELARSTGVTYRLAEDPRGETFALFGGAGMPTTVFIDEEGVVVETIAGELTEDQLLSLVEEHLGVDTESGTQKAASGNPEAALDPEDIMEVIAPDVIPSIDDPLFIEPSEANWLQEREPVVALELGSDARAYPLQILTWHEIVNDTVAGVPVVVTFCPLCNTAIAFERPRIGGEVTTFGTSGKLINSNLLMYDRKTESLWPQVTGVALTGSQKGLSLERVPVQIVSWGDFLRAHPDGVVLSRDTGHDRPYGENPYPGYDDVDDAPFLYSGEIDCRLAAMERVLGIEVRNEVVAFPYFRLRERARDGVSVAQANVGGDPIVVLWKGGTASALDDAEIAASRDVGSAAAFSRTVGNEKLDFIVARDTIRDRQTHSEWDIFGRAVAGRLEGERLDAIQTTDSFWFDWAAFHPETDLWHP